MNKQADADLDVICKHDFALHSNMRQLDMPGRPCGE